MRRPKMSTEPEITGHGTIPAEEQTSAGLAEFRRLKTQNEITAEGAERLADAAATSFLSHYLATGGYLQDAITLLCEIATLNEERLAKPGLKGIFPLIVERLSDSFNPECCSLYDRAFVQVLEFCRRLPVGNVLDTQLRQFGLVTSQDLLDRKEKVKGRKGKFDPFLKSTIKKVFLLSRVTLGADVAITSIMMGKMKRVFPNAELVLLGSPRLRQLFGGDSQVRVCEVPYERAGGLVERLNSWPEVVGALKSERRNLKPDEYLIVDPDSRFTQLGLLPLTEEDSGYYFFESRGYRKLGIGCISQLALNWLNDRFGDDDELYPYVSLVEKDRELAKRLCEMLRRRGAVCLVSVNFGVGDNMRKRVQDPFELRLVSTLIDDGNVVVLDKGFGREEIGRANQLIHDLREKRYRVAEINEQNASDLLCAETGYADVVVWEGGIGFFSALIAETGVYIGYDSACQHIASALEVPTIDIFADISHALFFERWRPFGKGRVEVVRVDSEGLNGEQGNYHRILDDVMACHRKIKTAMAR